MKAEEIYQIAKYLSNKELDRLRDMLNKKTTIYQLKKIKNTKIITDEIAIKYLLKTCFQKDSKIK